MPFTLIQSGTSLQVVTAAGAISTLTLPTGVTVSASRRLRAATLGRFVIVCNSVSQPLSIDVDLNVRVLCPRQPFQLAVLTAVAGGTLNGAFRVKYTNMVKDDFGNLIAESDFSPPSSISAVLVNQYLKAANLELSLDSITSRRLYRTATNGSEFFAWLDVSGNVLTEAQDDLPDAGLSLISAPTDLGPPPQRLANICEWGGRLWGYTRDDIDDLLYSSDGKFYAWPATNLFVIPPKGRDETGIVAFLPRRDQLGVARVDSLHQMTGKSDNSFSRTRVVDGIGCVSQESVYVHRDTAFFLGQDGVYTWDSGGVKSVSDEQVRAWFTGDLYFTRSRFPEAWATFDPLDNSYVLFLTSVGGTLGDRWVKYNPQRKTWFGPHKTGAFTPSAAGTALDANGSLRMLIGSSAGYIWKDRGATFSDDTATAIDLDCDAIHTGDSPDTEKYWGRSTFIVKPESAGNLVVTPKVGNLSAAAQASINVPLTRERSTLRNFGPGRHLQLNLRENTAAQGCEIRGYEVPYHGIGRRGGL